MNKMCPHTYIQTFLMSLSIKIKAQRWKTLQNSANINTTKSVFWIEGENFNIFLNTVSDVASRMFLGRAFHKQSAVT